MNTYLVNYDYNVLEITLNIQRAHCKHKKKSPQGSFSTMFNIYPRFDLHGSGAMWFELCDQLSGSSSGFGSEAISSEMAVSSFTTIISGASYFLRSVLISLYVFFISVVSVFSE